LLPGEHYVHILPPDIRSLTPQDDLSDTAALNEGFAGLGAVLCPGVQELSKAEAVRVSSGRETRLKDIVRTRSPYEGVGKPFTITEGATGPLNLTVISNPAEQTAR
jgi:hypothetical protein